MINLEWSYEGPVWYPSGMAAGLRVAEARGAKGWSQQALADAVAILGYKISQTGIDKIEKRDTSRPKCLRELAIALDVSEEWLMGEGQDQRADGEVVDTPHARLKASRLAAGFTSAAHAAKHFGFTVPTYNAHENGQNGINVDAAMVYAGAFDTTAEWLLLGKVEGVSVPIASKPVEIDPLLLATWQKLSVKQRTKLMQIALIISEE